MTPAVLVAGPWATHAGGTVLALDWIAAVVFGTSGERCTVLGGAETFVEGQPSYQVTHLSRRVEPGEGVTMRMFQGEVDLAEGSSAGDVAFDCLGTTIDPLPPGTYDVQVVVDEEVLAEGTFEVRPDPA